MEDRRTGLFRHKDPYDLRGTEANFVAAMAQNCRYQYRHCADYRRILDEQGFSPRDLRGIEDLGRLPVLPTLYLKGHALFSMPPERLAVKATSSGTSGKRSRIGFDLTSLRHGAAMVWRMTRYHQLLSPVPCHYLILGYEPHKSNQTAFAKTGYGFTYFAPAASRTYALRYRNGSYQLDLEGLLRRLKAAAGGPVPIRTIGFPAYTHLLLEEMKKRGLRLPMPHGSMITMGGGWKQFYAQKVEKEVLYQLAEEVLGIDEDHCVEFFGAVEHPILYTTCRRHHFHVPIYSRVIIRDPETLAPLPMGQMGMVNLLTPMVMSQPLLSVMTDDLGVLHPGESCGCGIQSPWLEIIGRVGVRDIVTCAAGAEAFLGQGGGSL